LPITTAFITVFDNPLISVENKGLSVEVITHVGVADAMFPWFRIVSSAHGDTNLATMVQ